MDDRDLMTLDREERRALDLSFNPGASEKRVRNIIINTGLVVVALSLLFAYGVGLVWMTGSALLILLVSASEKLSYSRSMSSYRSLVRKLAHRVEELEGSQPTPLGSHPAARFQRRREHGRPLSEEPPEQAAVEPERSNGRSPLRASQGRANAR